jgi:hypothetical protein
MLGDPDEARRTLAEARDLRERVGRANPVELFAMEVLSLFWDEGTDELGSIVSGLLAADLPALRWALGYFYAWSGRLAAVRGDADEAVSYLSRLMTWVERAPAWTGGMSIIPSYCVEVLWLLDRPDEAERIERVVHEKLVVPDFRGPGADARLSMARLCALTGRPDEAVAWFSAARDVLAEQGARPLLAVVDFDEARLHAGSPSPADQARARSLADTARAQFEALAMTGWVGRADDLSRRLG